MGIKFHVDELFFNKWSHSMSYVLGYLYADGSMEFNPRIRGKYIRFSSTDYSQLFKIRKALNSKHKIVKSHKKKVNHKNAWMLRIGNAKLYDSVSKLGVTPNKSLNMVLPTMPRKYICSFVRGYFDGDGCVYIEKYINKDGIKVTKRLRIIFTSGSKEFIVSLNRLLSSLKPAIESRIYYSSRAYRLILSTSNSILLFRLMYTDVNSDLLLKRKFDTFNEYFDIRKEKIDDEITTIINTLA